MLFSYVLYPHEAEKYHKRYNISPTSRKPVGILGHYMYTVDIKEYEVFKKLSQKSAEPFFHYIAYGIPKDIPAIFHDAWPVTEKGPVERKEIEDDRIVRILKGLYISKTGLEITVETAQYPNFIFFYPVYNSNYIYAKNKELFIERDLSEYLERDLLSCSPLALEYDGDFYGIQYHNNISTYNCSSDPLIVKEELVMRLFGMDSFVGKIEEKGYAYTENNFLSTLYVELAEVWGFRRKTTSRLTSLYRGKIPEMKRIRKYITLEKNIPDMVHKLEKQNERSGRLELGLPFPEWIKESCERIQLGKLPLLRFYYKDKEEAKNFLQEHYSALTQKNFLYEQIQDEFRVVELLEGNIAELPIFSPFDLDPGDAGFQKPDKGYIFPDSSLIHEEGSWFIRTEHQNLYQLEASSEEEASVIHDKWQRGEYATPWAIFLYQSFQVYSVAFLKNLKLNNIIENST